MLNAILDLLGLVRQMENYLNNTDNYLDIITHAIDGDTEFTFDDHLIAVNLTKQDILDFYNSKTTPSCEVFKLSDLYNAILNQQDSIPLYDNNGNKIDEYATQDAMNVLVTMRSTIEECIAVIDDIYDAAQTETTDVSSQLSVFQTYSKETYNFMAKILGTVGTGINPDNVSMIIGKTLDYFGYPSNSDSTDQVETYGVITPAAMRWNAFLPKAANVVQAITLYWINTPNYVLFFIRKIFEGIAWAIGLFKDRARKLFTSLILTPVGLADSVGKTGYVGDDTIALAGCQYSYHIYEDGYSPNFMQGLSYYAAYSNGKKFASFYTLGAKRTYQLSENGDLNVSIVPRLVNPITAYRILGIYLPTLFAGDSSDVTFFTYVENPKYIDNISEHSFNSIYEQLTAANLSFKDNNITDNAFYGAAIFYGKILDFIDLCKMTAICESTRTGTHVDPSILFNTHIGEICNPLGLAYNDARQYGYNNLGLYRRACSITNLSTNVAFGDFSATEGPQTYNVGWRTPLYWYLNCDANLCYYLFLLSDNTVMVDYINYSNRPFLFKPTYFIRSDQQMSDVAGAKLAMIGVGIVVLTTAILAVKYVPKFLRFRKQLILKRIALAGQWAQAADDQKEALWQKYRSTYWKSVLVNPSSAFIYGNEVDGSLPSISVNADTDLLTKIEKLISG